MGGRLTMGMRSPGAPVSSNSMQHVPDPPTTPAPLTTHPHPPVGRAQLLQREEAAAHCQLELCHVLGKLQPALRRQRPHLRAAHSVPHRIRRLHVLSMLRRQQLASPLPQIPVLS